MKKGERVREMEGGSGREREGGRERSPSLQLSPGSLSCWLHSAVTHGQPACMGARTAAFGRFLRTTGDGTMRVPERKIENVEENRGRDKNKRDNNNNKKRENSSVLEVGEGREVGSCG